MVGMLVQKVCFVKHIVYVNIKAMTVQVRGMLRGSHNPLQQQAESLHILQVAVYHTKSSPTTGHVDKLVASKHQSVEVKLSL